MPSAFVLVSCETDSAELFEAEVKKLHVVKYALRVSGVYEFLIKIDSESEEELKKTVQGIRSNNWVRSSLTLMIV